jgi:hypothetical protein
MVPARKNGTTRKKAIRDSKKNGEKMVVYYSEALSQSGPMVQQAIILPPLEAGSDRCSIKPASRRSCHFRSNEAQAFT